MSDESNTPALPRPRANPPGSRLHRCAGRARREIILKKRRSRVIFIGALVAFVVFAVVVRLIG